MSQAAASHTPARSADRAGRAVSASALGAALSESSTSAGRQLAERALHDSPGQALDPGLRQRLGARLGEDFSRVRLHHGPAVRTAATALGARAFTLGEHVALAGSHSFAAPAPASAQEGLLAHELAHVAQQRRGGALAADAPAAEREASAVQAQVATATPLLSGPQLGTAIGLACSREEWLQGSPDLSQRGFSELVEDIDDIGEWLGRQTTSSPESIRLDEALGLLKAEVARRQKSAARTKPKTAAKKKGKGAKAEAERARWKQMQIAPRYYGD